MARRTAPTAAGWWTEHPRAVLLVRAALYLLGAAVLAALAAAAVGFLGVLVALTGVAALVDAGGVSGVVPLGGLGVLVFVTLGGLVALGVRRLDARVVAAAERPDPLERLKRRYVTAEVDEAEFERRLERLLVDRRTDESSPRSRGARAEASRRSSTERRPESERV